MHCTTNAQQRLGVESDVRRTITATTLSRQSPREDSRESCVQPVSLCRCVTRCSLRVRAFDTMAHGERALRLPAGRVAVCWSGPRRSCRRPAAREARKTSSVTRARENQHTNKRACAITTGKRIKTPY